MIFDISLSLSFSLSLSLSLSLCLYLSLSVSLILQYLMAHPSAGMVPKWLTNANSCTLGFVHPLCHAWSGKAEHDKGILTSSNKPTPKNPNGLQEFHEIPSKKAPCWKPGPPHLQFTNRSSQTMVCASDTTKPRPRGKPQKSAIWK